MYLCIFCSRVFLYVFMYVFIIFNSTQTIFYEAKERYDGSGRDGYLTLEKGYQVEVLDKSDSDWLVCTVADACCGIEREGMVPNHVLTPVTRHGNNYLIVGTAKSAIITLSVQITPSYIFFGKRDIFILSTSKSSS